MNRCGGVVVATFKWDNLGQVESDAQGTVFCLGMLYGKIVNASTSKEAAKFKKEAIAIKKGG